MQALQSVLNMPEYVLREFWQYLAFWICQGSEYARVAQDSKYATIWPNMSEEDNKMPEFWIKDEVLNLYHPIIQYSYTFRNMTESWICIAMQLWNESEYFRILSMPGFSTCKHCVRFWICLNNVLWQGSEYAWSMFHRVLNKPPIINMSGLKIW